MRSSALARDASKNCAYCCRFGFSAARATHRLSAITIPNRSRLLIPMILAFGQDDVVIAPVRPPIDTTQRWPRPALARGRAFSYYTRPPRAGQDQPWPVDALSLYYTRPPRAR